MTSPAPTSLAPDDVPRLRRALGPFDAFSVVVGAIIGVGIFFTPTQVARIGGSAESALLAWTIGGAIALAGALTFAQLGARYPHAGGQYEILKDAYGALPAYLFAFCNATAIQAGSIAIIAIVTANNIAIAATGAPPAPTVSTALAATLIVALAGANCAGVRWGAGVQNVTVAAKLATLFGIVALAAFLAPPPPAATQAAPNPSDAAWTWMLLAAIVPTFFAYGGWQHALWMAGEIREPQRDLPRAVIGGVAVVVAVYLAANWAYLALLGFDRVASSSALAADAVGAVWPQVGRRLIAGAVAVSALGVLNAQLLSGPRLIYRMAADGRFFRVFARIGAHSGTPWAAVLLLGGAGLTLLLSAGIGAIDRLVTGVVFVDGVFFGLTALSAFVLARRARASNQPWRGFGYPIAPALFVAGEAAILCGAFYDPSQRAAVWIGLAWVAGGSILYALLFRDAKAGAPAASPASK